ncbi:MAG TPA: 2OG-Fe(II) oxygenase [Casimicrobiaceae bacterium]|nr:2OG-Fe(II) oxygenase [Casimicrobiaceae bacterium]
MPRSIHSLDRICAAVAEEGCAVERDFLTGAVVTALAADARRRDAAREFRAAGIGRGPELRKNEAIRGDRIAWIDEADADTSTRPWWVALERLRVALNQSMYLGLFSFEGHYAIYPCGAHYGRHRDGFHGDARRVLSCVLYLNESWGEADGGALRIYRDKDTRDILPAGGTLVCFLSERFEHEVLPARRERLALTGWFQRRP